MGDMSRHDIFLDFVMIFLTHDLMYISSSVSPEQDTTVPCTFDTQLSQVPSFL